MTRGGGALGPAVAAALLVLGLARAAAGGPVLLTTRPAPDGDTGDFVFFAGGISDSGRSLKGATFELVIDGQRKGSPASQPLAEWAAAAGEANPTWRPPVSVGLVYLWAEGVPAGVLDGIQAFFQRLPSRTPVFPTIYGRMRQGRARLTAADVSRLGDVAYLEGYRPNLLEAVRLDLPELAADPAPLKLLLLVTDGRDFADPKGDGPGDFGLLGKELRKAGITPLIVGFPPPEADAAQAAANLRDLHAASGGFLRSVEQVAEIENALESLGQAIADLNRFRVVPPWNWSVFGGAHRLSLKLTAAGGQRLTADVGAVTVGPGKLRWVVVGSLLAAAVIAGALALRGRRPPRRPRVDDAGDDDAVVKAAHDLVRRGASPKRAVEELSRTYPDRISSLINLDPEVLSDPRFPTFSRRPGRLRLQEIRDILAKNSEGHPAMGDRLAKMLARGIEEKADPEEAAKTLTARVGVDEWTAFAGLNLDQLAEALRGASRAHPVLGTPRARGIAVAIQDHLRAGGGGERGITIGWLVRVGGPGRRGETLRLGDRRTVIGQAPTCELCILGDAAVAPEHVEIVVEAGGFALGALGGTVTVEGTPVPRRHVLTDGESIAIGGGIYVFKSASAGNLSASAGSAPGRPPAQPASG